MFTDSAKLNLVKIRREVLVLGSSQFRLLPQLPQKMILTSKVVKVDSKIKISLHQSKYVTHCVSDCIIGKYTSTSSVKQVIQIFDGKFIVDFI